MWRDPERNSNFNNPNKYGSEETISNCTKIIIILMSLLSILRLFTLDIMGTISDLLGVLMLFFFYYGRTKCMAIFLMFNGVMGIIISYSKMSQMKAIAEMNGGYSDSDSFAMGVMVYGIFVYLLECILAFFGILKYSWDGIFARNDVFMNSNQQSSSNYGTMSGNQASENNNNRNYVPFSGRGTTIG